MKLFKSLLIISAVALMGCPPKDAEPAKDDFGIFNVVDTHTIEMNGVIGGNTPAHFDNVINANPSINKIILKDCPGSEDDEANLRVAKSTHDKNMEMHLTSTSVIASGAVDFFLAGTKRTMDKGAQIGVHSWSDGSKEATDFPVGHEYHLPYINYYVSVGFTQQQAEDFYYFTINSAPAAGVHWMTEAEIEQYGMLTE